MVLINHINCGQTVVQNVFIDRHMASANGEYVKVYLLILRLAGVVELTVANLADRLDMTEKDVMRALSYWEKCGLLGLTRSGDNLTHMTINGFAEAEDVVLEPEEAKLLSEERGFSAATESGAASSEASGDESKEQAAANGAPVRHSLEELSDREEFKTALFVAEMYLGRTLSPKDIDLIVLMYDEYGFPVDVIEHLIAYCVDSGHTTREYIDSVALSWHESGIKTLEQAKDQIRSFKLSTGYYKAVLRAFGIVGRAAVKHEEEFVDKWTKQMEFPIEVITEACSEAMKKNVRYPFEYTDKMLIAWKNEGIKSPADVKKYRQEHREAVKTKDGKNEEAIKKVKKEREEQQKKARDERDILAERRNAVISAIPDYTGIESDIINLSEQRILARMNGEDMRSDELMTRLTELRSKKSEMLRAAGFPDDYLEKI